MSATNDGGPFEASSHSKLIARIRDSRVPKDEMGHAAAREIDALEKSLREARESRNYWEHQAERERAERQKEIGMQEYRGNTISYIYDKAALYGAQAAEYKTKWESAEKELAELRAMLRASAAKEESAS